ncbi:hypothetical protein [Flavobacterium lindanitolerans]|jgi:hypothetical protein|uniref:Uncharacterized protein n=1 Tax=Flavobacterium lindanitolerans TaxID=428988 RepID=A0A497UW52_9FLAO|nr:hypothetical protein [Flavobacterium lindanitolerans]MBL7866915.1 hypothetical protein [Flavobacterium lindanitolerans]MDQ7961335.1 hypothetical protein [Flavobacterium lindanitolerans]PKW29279.1 hypothetical protein B0G92_0910 [Flavobacterium lindanitolerans]RLJ35220.1 hypothetical protein CLV50_0595 [Flavobacterium lindanitolerans]
MRNITDTVEGIKELDISLYLEEHLQFYKFSMMEITTENGNVLKSEVNKTIHSTILKKDFETYLIQLEVFDIEYKNRTVSLTEKDFLGRIAEVNDDIILETDEHLNINKLVNQHQIQKRLEEKIERLAKSNVGPKVEEMFQYLREFYSNDRRILLDIKNYRQHGLLLNPFYDRYTPLSVKKRSVRYLNFVENAVVNIGEEARVKKIKLKERELEVGVKGKMIAPFYNDMIFKSIKKKEISFDSEKDKPSLDKYEGSFIFNMNTGTVKKASIEIEFSLGNNYRKTISYQLNELNDADNN